MRDQFIPYEQAIDLYDLGFSKKTFQMYPLIELGESRLYRSHELSESLTDVVNPPPLKITNIPDHYAKYDTIPIYLLDTNRSAVLQGFKIVKYTHHFPAITIAKAPVYWTIWWRVVDLYFKPIEGDYTFLTVLK